MKHTTPWRYQEKLSGSENHRGYLVIDASGFRVADVSPRDEDGIEGKQLASLIAVAPQLLQALEEQVNRATQAYDLISERFPAGQVEDILELLEPGTRFNARAAIRAAKGEA